MVAKEYFQNKIVLENCKTCLEVLQFFPQYETLMTLMDKFSPETIFTSQNFISFKNKIKINFKLHSFDGIRIPEYYEYGPISSLFVEVECNKDRIISIQLMVIKGFIEEIIDVDLLNNNVIKIDRKFYENGFRKRKFLYYISNKLVSEILYDTSFKHPKVEYKMFVENSSVQGGNRWTEIINERDYGYDTCTTETSDEYKDISHNQFDKRFEGNQKRVRRFGKMPENSKY